MLRGKPAYQFWNEPGGHAEAALVSLYPVSVIRTFPGLGRATLCGAWNPGESLDMNKRASTPLKRQCG
jgi:hypothetical protein